ncbi:hypothetical protein [Pseudomonas panipatensis]|uniref:Outer membrane protein (Porin) n=1 Tax=Pseudomonas panipatensis TaxID=428992 RepID=A0A1G8KZT9_9PSED|nr:hypothetical protein [Pseudomonas panipatensis]SDI48893.1 Outer membrane protein (porin) [Pseudomonas panipatensis]SMP72940.1 Outer membrane protein (porin) [Pseudomonas panipatensis]
MRTTFRSLLLSSLLGTLGTAQALELYKGAQGSLDFNLEITAAPLYSSYDFGTAQARSVQWLESYVRSGFSGTTPLGGGAAYAGVGIMTSKIVGDGDASATSNGHESRTDFDTAFAGWKNDWFDLSAGRQDYQMGDGFLIDGDQLNYGERLGNGFNRGGLYYLSGRTSFARSAILRLHPSDGWLLEGFHLESGNNGQGTPHLDGVNSDYAVDEDNSLGLAYFTVNNVDSHVADGLFALRSGLDVYNLRGKSDLGVPSLSIEAGYAAERSSQVDAYAWYAGASYQFKSAPLAPQLGYRYSRFSGDAPASDKSEAFDPLFYGSTIGEPTWVQGEIAGTFAGPFNSNAKVSRLSLNASVSERLAVGAMAYRFDSAREAEHLADELDLHVETYLSEHLALVPIVGVWKPRQGATALYGEKRQQTFVALVTSFSL